MKAKNVKKGKRRNSDIDLILQVSFEKSFVALSRCADVEEDRTERVMSSRLLVLFSVANTAVASGQPLITSRLIVLVWHEQSK